MRGFSLRGRVARGAGFVALALVASWGSARAADIVGTLRNASTLGTVPDFDVRLTATLDDGERLDRTVQTDASGAYAFQDVPADTSSIYVLSTNYRGVEYVSRFFRFEFGVESLATELEVYDLGDDPSVIQITGHHYVIEAPPAASMLAVTEVFAIQNTSVTSFRPQHPMAFPLPSGATDYEPVEGFETSFVREDSVFYAAPIRPGRLEGAFRYRLPVEHPISFTAHQAHPTDLVSVLVAPITATVSSVGEPLTPLGEVDLGNGVFCMRYGIPAPPVGSSFTIDIDIPRADDDTRALAWIIVGVLLTTFAAVASFRDRAASPVPTEEIERLRAERDHRVEVLARFDERDDADEPERAKLFAKAVAVQELLDGAERAAGLPARD